MGDKIKEVCGKLDRSWVVGIIAILFAGGLVTGFLMGIVGAEAFIPVVTYVLGFLTPNKSIEKLIANKE